MHSPSSDHMVSTSGVARGGDLRRDRRRPRRMDAAAERRKDADAPVAKLIAHPFNDDVAIVRHYYCRKLLVGEVA